MTVYWMLFLVPAFSALFEAERAKGGIKFHFVLLLSAVFLIFAFRETGGDWYTYNILFNYIAQVSFSDAIEMSDPAYGALNWISNWLGFGIYGVNAACALIFLIGFARFCAREARPLLMLALAIPYLIIVVMVGYTRQGTAIGLELLAVTALMRRKLLPFLLWITAAAAFHRTAIVLLPLAYFAIPQRSGLLGRVSISATILAACVFLYIEAASSVDHFIENYLESERYSSQGALGRSIMSAAAAGVFLLNWRRWGHVWADRDIWLVFSIAALALVPLTQVASTMADRLGLYVIPLQIIVFARLPVLCRSRQEKQLMTIGALVLYALSLGTWLHFGQFATELWLPYRSLLLGEIA